MKQGTTPGESSQKEQEILHSSESFRTARRDRELQRNVANSRRWDPSEGRSTRGNVPISIAGVVQELMKRKWVPWPQQLLGNSLPYIGLGAAFLSDDRLQLSKENASILAREPSFHEMSFRNQIDGEPALLHGSPHYTNALLFTICRKINTITLSSKTFTELEPGSHLTSTKECGSNLVTHTTTSQKRNRNYGGAF